MHMNYYEKLKTEIEKHSINIEQVKEYAKLEQKLQDEDIFEKEYKHFFVDGILKNLIEVYIDSMNIQNVKNVNEIQEFKFSFVQEIKGYSNGISKHLSYRNFLYYKIINRVNYFDLKYENNINRFNKDEVVRYIIDILSSYGITNIEASDWTNIFDDVKTDRVFGDPQSSLKKNEKAVTFKCTINELINMYYMECLRYSYMNDGKEYNDTSSKYLDRIKKNKLKIKQWQ